MYINVVNNVYMEVVVAFIYSVAKTCSPSYMHSVAKYNNTLQFKTNGSMR